MAALADGDRAAINAQIQEDLSSEREVLGGLTKADLRAAVDAADTWVDSNSGSFNSAIPQPARTQLTSAQKARLLMHVVEKRFLTGV